VLENQFPIELAESRIAMASIMWRLTINYSLYKSEFVDKMMEIEVQNH
jgi:hypothetical protein